jgi:hypothetical protein
MKKVSVQLEFDKETTGTIRYKEVVPKGEEPVVVTVYIRKGPLKKHLGSPQSITLVLENPAGEDA